tara:strand:+ start:264 stop:1436 length:1173 start_codon:yes stop_codon:yes gene_type:complete
MEIITNITYISGPEVQIFFNNKKKKKNIKVEFWDRDSANLLYTHEDISDSGGWATASAKHFVNWKIKIFYGDKLIKVEDFDLKGKRVIINNISDCLGDSLAWAPYIEEFRKKHKCEVSYITEWRELLKNQYKKIKWIDKGTENLNDGNLVKLGYDIKYTLGWFLEQPNHDNYYTPQPRAFENPLQQAPCDILKLPYKEIKPKIKLGYKRPIKEKYVCISTQATGKSKLWNNPNGWEEVVDYLKQQGYKVFVIDKDSKYGYPESKHLKEDFNSIPKNAIDDTGDKPITRRIQYLEHCEFFIGLPSGLSWLAWASNCKTIMISGFSMDYTEFKPDVRIQNTDVCHGCWNKYSFNRESWDWCPDHSESKREYECTKTITSDIVIDEIKKLIGK